MYLTGAVAAQDIQFGEPSVRRARGRGYGSQCFIDKMDSKLG